MHLKSHFRIYLVLVTLLSSLLYFPINRLITGGGTALELDIDRMLPVIPIFVVPYLGAFIFWVGSVIAITRQRSRRIAIGFNLKLIMANLFAAGIYLFVPTYVNRPVIAGSDLFSQILNWIYSNDRVYNATPSGHTFITMICLLGMNKVFPKYKFWWYLISSLIILSTIFTKQHNVLDVVAGIVFALAVNYEVERYSRIYKK